MQFASSLMALSMPLLGQWSTAVAIGGLAPAPFKAQQFLDGVQMRIGLQELGRKHVTQESERKQPGD